MASRKPPTPPRKPAFEVVNEFCRENNIFLGLDAMPVHTSVEGIVIVQKPQIIVMYADEVKKATSQEGDTSHVEKK